MAESPDLWNTFVEWLQLRKVRRGDDYTHTSLASPSGSFNIPAHDFGEFMRLYKGLLANGHVLHFTEKHRHIGPLVVDLDFKFTKGATDTTANIGHRYTMQHIQTIYEIYRDAIRDFIDVESDDDLTCYVSEKDGASDKGTVIKDGVHMVFPKIVTTPTVQFMIREAVLPALEHPIKLGVACENDVSDVVDEAVILKNGWMMYGSAKPNCSPYIVTTVIHADGARHPPAEDNAALVDILSIRNKNDKSLIRDDASDQVRAREEEADAQQAARERARSMSSRALGEEHCTSNVCDDLEIAMKLVDILDPMRVDAYDDWIRLGLCLRGTDHRLLEKWIDVSRKSPKFVEGECERLWSRMRSDGLSTGTLHMWARNDNPDAYRDIMRDSLRHHIMISLSGTHHDIARVIYSMYKHEFVCASIVNKVWYEFRNHRWHQSDNGYNLRMRISTDVWKEFSKVAVQLNSTALSSEEQQEQKRHMENSKKLTELALKLKDARFKDYIMKECAELFYQEGFEEKLDSSVSLIGFENGVYDLDAHEFREGRPEDYISFTTGNEYMEYDPEHECVHAINTYLCQVLPNMAVREYVLLLFASFISGHVKEQKFHIWTGSGSNSKSKLVELFEKSFGDYCCKFPITLLTQKRVASNAANSELARAKGRRFACLQEPSEDERLNIGLMKELSGGDKIMARSLYKEPVEFKPQFKMLLLCNHLPNVPSDDGGTWRRIRVVEFTSRFVDTPREKNEFPIDLDLSAKMDRWKPHFMTMLLHYYMQYERDGITEPFEVIACTQEYKRQNDHMSDFVQNCIEAKENGFLLSSDAISELKAWAKESNIQMRIPAKPELEKMLSKTLGKCVMYNSAKGWKNFSLKPRMCGMLADDTFDS